MTTDIVEWAMRPATHAFEYISRPRSIERLIDEWNRAYHCFALAAKEFVLEFAECDEVLLNVLRQANSEGILGARVGQVRLLTFPLAVDLHVAKDRDFFRMFIHQDGKVILQGPHDLSVQSA